MLMRWLGGAAAAVMLGLTVSARAADDATASSNGGHWYDKINPFASKKADVPQIPPTVPLPANTAAGAAVRPTGTATPAKPAAASRESEDAAYWRRNDACLKLMQIALDTGNEDLQRQVDLLQQRVNELYKLRMQAAASGGSDEALLNQRLGTNGSRRDLMPAGRTRTDGRTANVREDRE
jgi:hypothetical protein